MGNMSYCRFNNTVLDLQDCQEVLSENFNGLVNEEDDCENSISYTERQKAVQLIEMCREIAEEWEDIDLDDHFTKQH